MIDDECSLQVQSDQDKRKERYNANETEQIRMITSLVLKDTSKLFIFFLSHRNRNSTSGEESSQRRKSSSKQARCMPQKKFVRTRRRKRRRRRNRCTYASSVFHFLHIKEEEKKTSEARKTL